MNFRDRSSLNEWNSITRILDTKRDEENKPDFMKNWHNENERFEKLI